MLRKLLGAVIVASALAGCEGPLDTAPYVDTNQLQGTWYEIARLPRSTQAGCTGTTATYTPISDGHFAVVNHCTLPDGTELQKAATLYVLGDKSNAKYGIDLGGFIGDYWITEVADDYRYIVVGHPSRNYLWILARDKHLATSDLEAIKTHETQNGFDVTKLEYTNQDGGMSPEAASCSVGFGSRGPIGVGLGLGALALVAGLRRRRAS
ncbi:MAG TPA: lipocalin family protein [Polyangiaceae bacterium]|jgi:apolipoprotein D and lipocalin family protein